MWKEGTLKVHDSIFHYKVSKLMLKRNDVIVANYDRGWDIKPSDPDTQLAVELLLHSENY